MVKSIQELLYNTSVLCPYSDYSEIVTSPIKISEKSCSRKNILPNISHLYNYIYIYISQTQTSNTKALKAQSEEKLIDIMVKVLYI